MDDMRVSLGAGDDTVVRPSSHNHTQARFSSSAIKMNTPAPVDVRVWEDSSSNEWMLDISCIGSIRRVRTDGRHAEPSTGQTSKGVLDLMPHVHQHAAAHEETLARTKLPRRGASGDEAAADADGDAACYVCASCV